MSATINQRAFELRRKLFELAGECKQLSVLAQNSIGDLDSRIDAAGQIEDVGGRLCATHDSLGDVFIDAARDEKDQRFSLLIREQQWESNHIHTTPDGRHFRHGDGVEVDGDGNEIVVNDNGTYRTEEYQISFEDRVVIEWDGESRTIRTYLLELIVSVERRDEGHLPQLIFLRNKGP